MSEVTWRQRKIQVTNEKVRLFLLSLQEFEDEIKVNRIEKISYHLNWRTHRLG